MNDCVNEDEIKIARNIQYDIDSIFVRRWSPRAFTGQGVKHTDFLAIVEAGRLAPSSSNGQPWRFIYAHRDTEDWPHLFELLVPANQEWAKNAALILLIVSKKFDDQGRESGTQSFDTGAAWGYMALEASRRGTPLHGMGGFDHEKARINFTLGDQYKVEAMTALGIPGNLEGLSEKNRSREKSNSRKPIEEISIKANRASDLLAR